MVATPRAGTFTWCTSHGPPACFGLLCATVQRMISGLRLHCCALRPVLMQALVICVQADPHDLLALLNWFREGCDADATAELVFPPHLSKKQRAHIHS